MQFFSPWAVTAAIAPEAIAPFLREIWQAASQEIGTGQLLGVIVLFQAVSIAAYWVGSIIFAPGRATLGRAVATWINMVGLGIAAAIGLAATATVIVNKGQENRLAWLAVPAVILLAFAIALAIPVKIYQISAWRSLGLLLVQFVVVGATGTAVQMTMLGSRPPISPELLERVRTAADATPRPAASETLRHDLNERFKQLNRRHEQLEIRSRYLPPNDSSARAEYERDKAAYDRDLEQLRADAAALPK